MRVYIIGMFLLLTSSFAVAAGWQLDNSKSVLHFTSTKNETIAEQNQFKQLTGHIDDKGHVELQVDLNSVDTRIPIRDQRLRDILFETVTFPQATFTADVDSAKINELKDKQPHTLALNGVLDLHGIKHTIKTDILVQQLDDNSLQVKNVHPIVLNANDYDLSNGVEELRGLALLKSISPDVPVNFTLIFTADK